MVSGSVCVSVYLGGHSWTERRSCLCLQDCHLAILREGDAKKASSTWFSFNLGPLKINQTWDAPSSPQIKRKFGMEKRGWLEGRGWLEESVYKKIVRLQKKLVGNFCKLSSPLWEGKVFLMAISWLILGGMSNMSFWMARLPDCLLHFGQSQIWKGQKRRVFRSPKQRCAWKPGGSSLAPYYEGVFRYPSSLAPFQAPASLKNAFFVILVADKSPASLEGGQVKASQNDMTEMCLQKISISKSTKKKSPPKQLASGI